MTAFEEFEQELANPGSVKAPPLRVVGDAPPPGDPPPRVTRDRDDDPADPGEPVGPDAAPASGEADGVNGRHPNAPKLPEIKIGTDMLEVGDRAMDALKARGGFYVRGRRLARIVKEYTAPKYLKVADGLPVIAPLAEATLREQVSAAAHFKKRVVRKSGEEWVAMIPPDWLAKALVAREEWPGVPVLEGISDAPVLRADGTIHDTPGYDKESRYIFVPSAEWTKIPQRLTQDHARAAYKELCDPYKDMLYVSGRGTGCDLAATVSLILTTVGRAAIHGPVPAHMATANTPGSAKTLVIDTAAIIATGKEASKTPCTHDDSEMRKRMTPIAIAGLPIVSIDNVEGSFGSESLAMALTSNTWRDRILGKSEDCGDLPWRTVLCFNGNGVQLVGDLGRRCVPIRFDPRMEHPEDRTDINYKDLRGHVAEHRPQLYRAALIMLAAWLRSPERRKPSGKGSFEHWDAVVRGAILWAGGADINDGMQELRKSGDHDLERLRALIGEMRLLPTVQDQTTSRILDLAKNTGLQDAIDSYGIKGEPVNGRRLGAVFSKYAGRGVTLEYKDSTGEPVRKLYCIVKGDNAMGGVARWRIEEVAP